MTAENALLKYESGRTFTPMTAMTDSGDHTLFTSAASLWSGRSGSTPNVKPNGLATGGAVIPAVAAGNNNVDVAALTCYLAGVKTTVAADTDVACTRPATAVSKVNSITVNSSGAIAVVVGTDGATTAFSATRGAAGGPPYIPVGSIEIAQVRFTDDTAAPVLETEIYDVPGTHQELYQQPIWTENRKAGTIEFAAALPLIHTGDLPKGVYVAYYEPIFADIPIASDFVPSANSHTVNSKQYYGVTRGSVSSSLGQGSFTAVLNDGINDPILQEIDQTIFFQFFPDRYQDSYILDQGKLGIKETYPPGDDITAACTISASEKHTKVPV